MLLRMDGIEYQMEAAEWYHHLVDPPFASMTSWILWGMVATRLSSLLAGMAFHSSNTACVICLASLGRGLRVDISLHRKPYVLEWVQIW